MKKAKYIIFTLFLAVFTFSDVYAKACYHMPGTNNAYRVPEDYNTVCIYKYMGVDETHAYEKGSSKTLNGYIKLVFDKSQWKLYNIKTGSGNSWKDEDTLIMSATINGDITPMQTIDFDGFQITSAAENNGQGTDIKHLFKSDIQGCPNFFYWQDGDAVGAHENKIVFSDAEPTINEVGENDKYASYMLADMVRSNGQIISYDNVISGYTGLESSMIFMSKDQNALDPPPIIFSNYREEEDDDIIEIYDEALNCTGADDAGGINNGGVIDEEYVTGTRHENKILQTCKYRYGFITSTCQERTMTLTYNSSITTYPDGKKEGTIAVNADNGQHDVIGLDRIQEILTEIDINNKDTYSKLSDFLQYNPHNDTWSCVANLYYAYRPQDSNFIFPTSRLELWQSELGANGGNYIYTLTMDPDEEVCISEKRKASLSKLDIDWGDEADVTCDGILGPEMIGLLKKVFTWIKIIAPILVIVLGSVDYAGALLKDDKDALSKATSKFVKRLIIAALIFFIPTMINFLLDIYNDVRGVDVTTCM